MPPGSVFSALRERVIARGGCLPWVRAAVSAANRFAIDGCIVRARDRLTALITERPSFGSLTRGVLTWGGRRSVLSSEDRANTHCILANHHLLNGYLERLDLIDILLDDLTISRSGHPQLPAESFRAFRDRIPHLFRDGDRLLTCLDNLTVILEGGTLPDHIRRHLKMSGDAIRTLVLTASITAPTDLWLLRQILSTHRKIGTLDYLNDGGVLVVHEYAAVHNLDPAQLDRDLAFLYARGYLDRKDEGYVKGSGAGVFVVEQIRALGDDFKIDFVSELTEFLQGTLDETRSARIERWLHVDDLPTLAQDWVADLRQIEIGYRLVPVVLALKAAGALDNIEVGQTFNPRNATRQILWILEEAGLLRDGVVTALGKRVFRKGPGPFGIIAAYHSYLNQHEALLGTTGERPHVARDKNITASQSAHQGIFKLANDALDRFCRIYHFSYSYFIEHALGMAEAIREHHRRHPGTGITYFGADAETTPLETVGSEVVAGRLPPIKKLVHADIGCPEDLLDVIGRDRLRSQNGVMMVSAGFHEVRCRPGETQEGFDARMIGAFRQYREAGIILSFTETPDLTDAEILGSAWNTYHAGFRWVHQTSGQNLRRDWRGDDPDSPMSWREVVLAAGYVILPEFTVAQRRVFPTPLPDYQNPPISITYLCVPREVALRLGISRALLAT